MILKSNVNKNNKVESIKRKSIQFSDKFIDFEVEKTINSIRGRTEFYDHVNHSKYNIGCLSFILKDACEILVIHMTNGNIYKYDIDTGYINKVSFHVDGEIISNIKYDDLHIFPYFLLEEISTSNFNINRYRVTHK